MLRRSAFVVFAILLASCAQDGADETALAMLSTDRDPVLGVHIEPENNDHYDRVHQYGGWKSVPGTCYNVRAQVLKDESEVPVTFSGTSRPCRVIAGRWYGAYTDQIYTNVGDLQIDHVVPLKEAHQSGASRWDWDRRVAYANYLDNEDHLIAVHGPTNGSKGFQALAEWLPSDGRDDAFDCDYVWIFTDIKREWDLSMDPEEAAVARQYFEKCGY